jgi:hypothetical protein
MGRIKRALVAVLLLIATLYVCDYASVHYRIYEKRNPLGTVQIQRYYAVREKNRKTEFMFTDPETETCIYSLFPHLGYSPCWYLSRKKVKRVDA